MVLTLRGRQYDTARVNNIYQIKLQKQRTLRKSKFSNKMEMDLPVLN